jgi:hypothetical protein
MFGWPIDPQAASMNVSDAKQKLMEAYFMRNPFLCPNHLRALVGRGELKYPTIPSC